MIPKAVWTTTLIVLFLIPTSNTQGILVVARSRYLRWLDLSVPSDPGTRILVKGLRDVRAVSYDPVEQPVYWSDGGTISRAKLDGSGQEVIQTVNRVDGMVINPSNRTIYWTDVGNGVIEASLLDGTGRRVLVDSDLEKPRGIALDQDRNMLYWTDWGSNPKIERSSTEGTARQTLVDTNVIYPNDLALDAANDVMYWVDAGTDTLKAADLDGGNRRTVYDVSSPFSLTVFEDLLFWADKDNGAVQKFNTKLDGGYNAILSYISRLFGMKTVIVAPDTNVAFIAGGSEIRELVLDTDDDLGKVIPLENLLGANSVDYNPQDGYIYWSDQSKKQINRALRDGTGQVTLVNSEVETIEDIVVGVRSGRVFWTDSGTDHIESCNLDGSDRTVFVSLGLDQPRAIALDESDSMIYWTDWGEFARIERAQLDGTGREDIVNTSIGWPNDLALDLAASKMYWLDGRLQQIEVANLDGSNRQILISKNLQQGYGLSILGEYLYWIDWAFTAVYRMTVTGRGAVQLVLDASSPFTGVAAVTTNGQTVRTSTSAAFTPPTTTLTTTAPFTPTSKSSTSNPFTPTTKGSTTTKTTTLPFRETISSNEPLVESIYPDFGPLGGGTVVTIEGQHFTIPVVSVKMGNVTISADDIHRRSTILVEVTSPAVPGSYVGLSLPISIQFMGEPRYETSYTFQYRPNPSIESVEPLSTIPDGGITLTVNGTDLDSVAGPEMNFTVVNRRDQESENNTKHVSYLLPCVVKSAVRMHCITPRINISVKQSPCQMQDNSYQSCFMDDDVTIYIGIILDGIPDYRNLSNTPDLREYGKLGLTFSPEFKEEQEFTFSGLPILIHGMYIRTCCGTGEFRVYVGNGTCSDVIMTSDDAISCIPPRKPPRELPKMYRQRNGHRVQVHVGKNLQVEIGYLIYTESQPVWVIAVPSVCAIVVVVAIVVSIVFVIWRRRQQCKKATDSKHEAPIHDDGKLGFSAVRMSNLSGFDDFTADDERDTKNIDSPYHDIDGNEKCHHIGGNDPWGNVKHDPDYADVAKLCSYNYTNLYVAGP